MGQSIEVKPLTQHESQELLNGRVSREVKDPALAKFGEGRPLLLKLLAGAISL
jgi:hypothetical protein